MKIPHYSTHKSLSPAELKKFRSFVAQLKKQGVIPAKIDARIARPNFVRSIGPRGGKKSLAEVVWSNRAKLQPIPVHPKLTPPGKPGLLVRDFPHSHKSLASVIKDLETNAKEIDKLKKPGDKFAFQIGGTDSLIIYSDIARIARYLSESAGIQQLFTKHQKSQEIYNSLKIIRWNKSATEWVRQRQVKSNKKHAGRTAKNRRKK